MITSRFVTVVVLAAVITLGGRVGWPGFRWADPGPSLEQYRVQVLDLPEQLGDWVLEDQRELSQPVQDELECGDAYVWREYINTHLGGRLSLILMAGPPGPLTAHTPEICYSANAYQLTSTMPMEFRHLDGEGIDELQRVHLKSNRLHDEDLVVIYGWSDGQAWRVPSWPRLAFTHRTAILKIQLALSAGVNRTADQEREMVLDFLHQLRSKLNQRASVEGHRDDPVQVE
jgi:hypothetical protein